MVLKKLINEMKPPTVSECPKPLPLGFFHEADREINI